MLKKILAGLVVLVIAGAGGAYWYVNDRARSVVDERLDAMVADGSYDVAEYEALNVQLNGDIAMTNLHVVQGPLEYTLQNITISNLDYGNEFPRHMDVTVNGLQLAVDASSPDPQVAAMSSMLDMLGAGTDIPLQVNYSLRYDPDNAHQTDSTMRVAVPDAFTLDVNSITRNLQMQAFNNLSNPNIDPVQAQAQLMELLATAEIPSLQLALLDEGFLDVMMATAAEQNGVALEEFRTLLVSQAQNFYLFMPQNAQGLAMSAGAEIAKFLEGGKTLSVSIAPEYGGNIKQLQEQIMGAVFTGDYNQVSEVLHLEITAQ
jgi:hypothetical protein